MSHLLLVITLLVTGPNAFAADEKANAWYEKHKDSVEAKRAKYWVKWLETPILFSIV